MNILKLLPGLCLAALVLPACSQYEKKNISAISIQQNALPNHEQVKMVHFSGGPNENPDKEYYYQYTVVTLESLDTFRILCPEPMTMDSLPKTLSPLTPKTRLIC